MVESIERLWRRIDERLEPARIRFVCGAVIALSVFLLVYSFMTAKDGITHFGPPLGADFAGFYNAGTIVNQPEAAQRNRLYDTAYQDALYHQLLPGLADEKQLPFVHPPFVALVFQQFARLPYSAAFWLWLMVSALMYVGGLSLLRKSVCRDVPFDWATAVLLALSFQPFIMECWIGGQLSSLGFLCVAAALAFHQHQRPVLAGMALGCLIYKPTLLVLIGPFLVISRQWRHLAGFTVASIVLLGISALGAGWSNCRSYVDLLLGFAQTTAGAVGGLELPLWKYVDLNSFYRLWLRDSQIHWFLVVATALPLLVVLGRRWWTFTEKSQVEKRLTWAATLCGTLVINLYVGVYDTVWLVPATLLTTAVVGLSPRWRALLIAIYIVPWITQPIARHTGLQLFTILIWITTLAILRCRPSGDGLEAEQRSPESSNVYVTYTPKASKHCAYENDSRCSPPSGP